MSLWLSHHWPSEHNRCVLIGKKHVCRRCLVLYPLAFGVLVGATALNLGRTNAAGLLVIFGVGLIPALVEAATENLGAITYSPRRQVAITIPAGIGLGCGFAVYVQEPTSLGFWAIAAAAVLAGVIPMLIGMRRANLDK